MTAGYDPSGVSRPPDQPGEQARHAAADPTSDPGRLGPLPPRMTSTGSFPTLSQPAGGFNVPPPAPPPTSGFPPTGGFPTAPTSPYATGGQPPVSGNPF